MSPALTELLHTLPPGAVLTDPAELLVYQCDGFTIAKARPAAVVFAQSTQEVVAVVKLLGRHGAQKPDARREVQVRVGKSKRPLSRPLSLIHI